MEEEHAHDPPFSAVSALTITSGVSECKGGGMKRRYQVLFVPGSGDRDSLTIGTWQDSDVGVGLRRGLPADLLARLDLKSSSQEPLLRAAPAVDILAAAIGQNISDPGPATDCPCCAKRKFYRSYSDFFRWAPGLLRFVERQYVGLLHPDVVRFVGDPELRAAVRQQLREDLDQVKPHVVLGHSLGAVVAIEALAVSAWSPQLLITAGAPLAWPRFAETWSREAGQWLTRKSCAWINLIDLSDEVTGFQIPPMRPYANARNIVVGNDHYSTFFGPDGGFSSTHSLRHYLRHPAVRDAFQDVCD